MSPLELAPCNQFTTVCVSFPGNSKQTQLRGTCQCSAKLQEFRQSLKIQFLLSHLDLFLDSLGAVSDEQGESNFHKDGKTASKSMRLFYMWRLLLFFCSAKQTVRHTRENQISATFKLHHLQPPLSTRTHFYAMEHFLRIVSKVSDELPYCYY